MGTDAQRNKKNNYWFNRKGKMATSKRDVVQKKMRGSHRKQGLQIAKE